ncbi:MAG: hypothetical protein RLZZ172_2835, partial [Bacteroidota bacterium]
MHEKKFPSSAAFRHNPVQPQPDCFQFFISQFVAMKLFESHFSFQSVVQRINSHQLLVCLLAICLQSFSSGPFNHFDNALPGRTAIRNVIKGRLLNERGEPLSGCTISEKGTPNSTQSAVDGSFSIDVAGTASTLIVSYIGYETLEVKVGNLSNFNLTLT